MFSPIELDISGQPPRKSNGRRIVQTRSGKPRLIKSKEALAWLKAGSRDVPTEARQRVGDKDHLLSITFFVRYASRRPDLSVELILDFLEEERVILNDRYAFEYHVHKEIDKHNPGVKIVVSPYIPGLFGFLYNLSQKALAWVRQHGQSFFVLAEKIEEDGWF